MNTAPYPVVLAGVNARYRHTAFGLRCLKAALGERESQCVIEETTIKGDQDTFAKTILQHSPQIVGIGVYIWNVPQVESLVARLKALKPDLIIVLGGPEVSHETEGQPVVELADFVICGEGEEVFAQLVEAILQGRETGPRIQDGGLPDLSSLPSPYPLYTDEDIANRVVYVEASRGCPFKCQFCLSSLDKKVRQVPLERFFEDMEVLLLRGARDFKFIDRTFNLKLDVSTRILRFFLDRIDAGISLHFEMIPDRLPDALKELLASFPPGIVQLEVGIQTFDKATAAKIERRQNYDKTEDNIRYLHEHTGVHLHTDLIVGLPGENLETFAMGFDRLIDLRPQEIQVGILKRLKGTPIRMHDQASGMKYNPDPPFDVLQTDVLSPEETEEMKHFSRLWDRIANSGNFVEGLPLLWRDSHGPFVSFRGLVQYFLGIYGRSFGISLVDLHRGMLAYLVEVSGVDEVEARETLHRDFHRTPGRKTPRFLHVDNPLPARYQTGTGGALKRQERHLAAR